MMETTKWTYNDLRTPSVEFGIEEWYFCGDLRPVFGLVSNVDADRMLGDCGVYEDLNADRKPETVLLWVYFKQEKEARQFIDELNTFYASLKRRLAQAGL